MRMVENVYKNTEASELLRPISKKICLLTFACIYFYFIINKTSSIIM